MAMNAVIGALRVNLGIDTAAFNKGLQSMNSTLASAGKSMQRVGRNLSMYVTAPIAGFGALVLKTAGDFEMAMNKVAAVSGATGDEFDQLKEKAKELGATTQFTASEAADAMSFLAMAGFSANEVLETIPGTLQLAASAQMDLGRAADIVSNILTSQGMETTELARVNDVLVKAFTSANTDLEQLGEAFKFAGPLTRAAGVQFEEAAAALALMGNAGIQASMAGTSLRGAITRILNPTKQVREAMAEAGLNFKDAEGKLLPLVDIIRQLEPHAENAGLLMLLFGQRAGPAMAGLVSQGADAVSSLTTELENAAGVSEEIASVQMKGFNGAMRELTSAFEGLMIAIAESGVLEFVTDLVKQVSAFVRSLRETNPELLKWGVAIAALAAVIGPVLVTLGLLASAIAAVNAPIILIIGAAVLLGEGLYQLQQNFDTVKAAIAAAVEAIYNAVKDFLLDRLNAVWESVVGGINKVGDAFKWLYESVVGHSWIPDMVEGVDAWMGQLGDSFGGWIDQMVAGTFNLQDALAGLLKDLAKAAANNLFQSLIGGVFGGASGAGGLLGGLLGFAGGGSFRVGGSGGVDSQLVAFRATPNEMVDVRKPGQDMGGGVTVNNTYQFNNVDPTMRPWIEGRLRQVEARSVAGGTAAVRRGRYNDPAWFGGS